MKHVSRIYLCLIFAILYIPIVTLILFSFNDANSTAEFTKFSFRWYIELFNSEEAFMALRNTLILAVLSALLSTVIGTAAAEGIYRIKSKIIKSSITSVTNIPMMNPDIVTGMSMMLFFAAALGVMKLVFVNMDYDDIGFAAMLIAHTTFCLPYVILSVLPTINEMGNTLHEAALDLGCTPIKAFFKVKLPNIMPAVLSGMVMAFTLSLDDFVISYFVGPSNFQTLPLLIYSMTKKKVTPDMYALSTIVIVAVFVLLIISNIKSGKSTGNDRKKKRLAAIITVAVSVVLILTVIVVSAVKSANENKATGGPSDTVVLNVYNWGEYIADGFEGGYDTNAAFEDYFNNESGLAEKYGFKVKVNYTTYATNEDMYSKLKNGAVSYDIVIPSDYMVMKMAEEGMLLSFNVAEDIPNYKYIADEFKNSPYYDPNNCYSVPYTYGMMGIIYNTDGVDEEDIGSWDLLWNEKYSGKILQFNNPRDGFATAMYLLGYDVNSTDPDVWRAALEKMIKQKPLIQGYVNDEIFNKMTTESALIAPYYVGDFITMQEEQENLSFYFPEEGVNYFVDAMCIPINAKNPEIAKEYINFMLSEEAAVANADYIGYASPNTLVYDPATGYVNPDYLESYGEELIELLYGTSPSEVNAKYNAKFGKDATCYRSFSPEIQTLTNKLWEELKLADATEPWVHVTAIVIVVGVVGFAGYVIISRKWRSRHYRLRDKIAREEKKRLLKEKQSQKA